MGREGPLFSNYRTQKFEYHRRANSLIDFDLDFGIKLGFEEEVCRSLWLGARGSSGPI